MLRAQLVSENFMCFPCLSECRAAVVDEEWELISVEMAQYLARLSTEFQTRFPDESRNYEAVRHPFDTEPSALAASGNAAIQLIDMQSNSDVKRQFAQAEICSFWLQLDQSRYGALRTYALQMLTRFGSTYVCEASFSTMNVVKSKYRSRLSNANLESNLRVALSDYKPDYDRLVSDMQHHPSH
jgi:17beta-estradiol 17-dehydrogenase/3beta-hydroxysteroid 3-dehydrogenase/mitotic-spindle organizing protein 1